MLYLHSCNIFYHEIEQKQKASCNYSYAYYYVPLRLKYRCMHKFCLNNGKGFLAAPFPALLNAPYFYIVTYNI